MKHIISASAAILAAMTVSALAGDSEKTQGKKDCDRKPGIESKEEGRGKFRDERPDRPDRERFQGGRMEGPGMESKEEGRGKFRGERPDRPDRERFQGGRMEGPGMENAMLFRILDNKKIADEILLTEQQRANLEEAFSAADKDLETVKPKLEEATQKQEEAVKSANPDTDAIMAQVDEVWKLRGEIAKIQTRKILSLQKELSPEQIARAKKLFKARHFEMMQGKRPGPDGDRREMKREKKEGKQRPEKEMPPKD